LAAAHAERNMAASAATTPNVSRVRITD
jgi:hypothetical protein